MRSRQIICLHVLSHRPWHTLVMLLFIASMAQPAVASDFEPRGLQFSYGLNLGGYIANDATGNYYNGSGRNNLKETLMRQHTYNRIREALGYDFEFPGEAHEYLPQDMSYSPAMLVGVFGSLHFNQRYSLQAEFNFTRLRLQDQFLLRILRGDPGFIDDDIERFNIMGAEERSDIRIGIQRIFPLTEQQVHPYLEAGANIISTRVKENRVQIAGNRYSILNLTDTRYGFRDDGISFGLYAGGGLKMDVGENYALLLGAIGNYASINLGDNNKYNMHYSIFLRLFLNTGTEISPAE
jgi:hypothetical protein